MTKTFDIKCPYCGYNTANIMSCVRTCNNKVEINFICPDCGSGDSETHYLYNDNE